MQYKHLTQSLKKYLNEEVRKRKKGEEKWDTEMKKVDRSAGRPAV